MRFIEPGEITAVSTDCIRKMMAGIQTFKNPVTRLVQTWCDSKLLVLNSTINTSLIAPDFSCMVKLLLEKENICANYLSKFQIDFGGD